MRLTYKKMDNLKKILLALFLISSVQCGVKGKPSAPKTAPKIGQGAYVPVNNSQKKQKVRVIQNPEESDWQDEPDEK